jgi:hypothetical protein
VFGNNASKRSSKKTVSSAFGEHLASDVGYVNATHHGHDR